ncbi:transglutaminase-like putative cysteine protease [Allocatelliglobosispora scoriae]|uniref:Transglutaminase-like putative cysteine protease n=1 Tax=Allocatelliglobosispora scoriae TaxID=643052 RepID=A0A841BGG7_9ACTN|nr:transglutaminase domain-containing protein [Allocatelliglobosispora scoriae]MBB5867374.1 transglutaminase-like putative cysteine protease [Allocatelliglobosispora scoriae]
MNRAVRLTVAGLLGLAPVVAFAPAFGRTAHATLGDTAYLVPTAAAAVLAAGTAIALGLGTRWTGSGRILAALGVLAGVVTVMINPGWQVVTGPQRLLTAALPYDVSGPELATVAALSGLAAIGAVEGALRRGRLLPLAVPVAVTALACSLGATVGPPPWWLVPSLLIAALVLLWRGPLRVAPVVLAGIVLAATLAGPALLSTAGRATPFDLRSLATPPVEPLVTTSPLAQFAAVRSGRLPLSLRVDADAAPARLRYLALDRFDGEYWTSTAQYRRAGEQLPDPGAVPSRTVTERVTIDQLGPLGWLVSSGRPVAVSVPGLGVDELGGAVALPDGGPAPMAYTVRSRVRDWSAEQLDTAVPARIPADAQTGIPADLGTEAQRIVGGAYGHAALSALAARFAHDGGFSVVEPRDTRPGHGVLHIRRLLTDRQGSAEQYASAYAVLARALGYDARVVVGFVPRPEAGGYRVAGRDIDAWAEVRFDGLGWAPYYPTPGQKGAPTDPPDQPEPELDVPPDQQNPESADPGATAALPIGEEESAALSPWLLLAAVGVLGILLLTVPPLAKVMIRRRRRRGSAAGRVLGSWRDTVDRLVEADVRILPSATAREGATAADGLLDGTTINELLELAALHDSAAYGPVPLTDADADRAWTHAGKVRHAIRSSLTPRRRARALLSLRPLVRRTLGGSGSLSRVRVWAASAGHNGVETGRRRVQPLDQID